MELTPNTKLSVKNVSCSFDGVRAVSELSCDVLAGTVTAVIGPNGAGKTTLFNLCSGFLHPDTGSVHVAGHATTRMRPYRVSQLGLGRTFQDCKVFDQLPVLDNVMLGFRDPRQETVLAAIMRRRVIRDSEQSREERSVELLDEAGLRGGIGALAGDLSYGQRKLLELCRVRAMNPSIFLLDEPFAGLSPQIAGTMKSIIARLAKSGRAVVFIEHDMHAVAELADRVLVMHLGSLIADGGPQAVLRDPAVLDAYLGSIAKR